MKNWTAIPNFVDTAVFHPREGGDDWLLFREKHAIPADALVFGCAAAVKKHHKRIDYLIREFAKFVEQDDREERDGKIQSCRGEKQQVQSPPSSRSSRSSCKKPYLIIAGSRQKDSAELVQLARELAGDRIKIIFDVSREDMPVFFRACDCFVLTSLFEMMPIAVLEALASGLPVIANQHPVLEWMVGAGGKNIDMRSENGLADCLQNITPEWLAERGTAARNHALANFSKEAVIQQYIDYYQQILNA